MALRILRRLIFTLSALGLLTFAYVTARYMMIVALNPVELSVLEHADRFAHGQPLYLERVPPVPSMMPGVPIAISPAVGLFGAGLWIPRTLTVITTLLIAGLVLLSVRRETESWTLAAASAGFVFLGFGLLVEPPGFVRPESTMLLMSLLAFYVLRVTFGFFGALASALLFSFAFFSGPHAVWFIAGAVFATALDDRNRLLPFAGALVAMVGGGYFALLSAVGPSLNLNAWEAPLRTLSFNGASLLHYIGDHLLGKLGVLTLAAVLTLALPTQPWRGKGGLWMWMGAATLVLGLLSTQSTEIGSWVLMPSVVMLSILGPISIHRVTRHLSALPGANRLGGRGVVLAAVTLQFIVFLSCLSASRWLPGAPS